MNVAVIGTQWGDEGKGKIVDHLAERADVVARWGGGANAGHTVLADGRKFVTHLLPIGALRNGVTCVLGGGMVIDPWRLVEEARTLEKLDRRLWDRVHVFRSAHLVLPCHLNCDANDRALDLTLRIGTTGRGIGPAYGDKATRVGLRMGDLDQPEVLLSKLERLWHERKRTFDLRRFPSLDALFGEIESLAHVIAPHLVDGPRFMRRLLLEKRDILFEGAQGVLLDLDLGTYPFVTSSSTGPGGIFTGLAVPWYALDHVVGVVKAYTTRVGNGPFPTEATKKDASRLRKRGGEFGATTGRARRCGWLDLVAVRYSVRTAGVTSIALTKLDVLDADKQIPVCIAYEFEGRYVEDFPGDGFVLARAKPVYEYVDGWNTKTAGVRSWPKLPKQAKAYVKRIEEFCGCPVEIISTGARREQTIVR